MRALLLDDDPDVRIALGEALEFLGATPCLIGSYRELLDSRSAVLACDLAILDINLGEGTASGVDAYSWLREQDFAGEVLFLTGHATDHPLVQEAAKLRRVRILMKPIDLQELSAILRGIEQ
jgi:DNA-binding NtrC family response regulator